jgi:hypothetical protein
MTSRDFCFWLQGFLELRASETPGINTAQGLNYDQTQCLRKHLALVFKHEIDPSMGGPIEQTTLDKLHGGGGTGGNASGGGPVYRC